MFRPAAARCGPCIETPGCAFCESTLTCVNADALDESECAKWTTKANTCPVLPECKMNKACSTCVAYGGCSWCQSLNKCMSSGETSFVQCKGKVSLGGFCPNPFTETTTVEGNLIVEGEVDRMGGSIHVHGPCNTGKSHVY